VKWSILRGELRRTRLARSFGVGVALAWGVPIVVASCAAAHPKAAIPQDGSASGLDVGTGDSRAQCAPPNVTSRCDGTDPLVVFFPPVTCDPTVPAHDAGDAAGAADAADAEGGPCASVLPTDVSFTPLACQAFAEAESAGGISFERSGGTPTIISPRDGDALTPEAWSIFAWNKGPQAQRRPLEELVEWMEPSAHALTPLRGDGYVIEFTQGCTEILRAMVADIFWAPDPASWSVLTATHGPVIVRVYWAKYSIDAIVAGPVASDPITITMMH
jgi:hypothetical protein